MPFLGQYREYEAKTWLILKLEESCIQKKNPEFKIRFFGGSTHSPKYGKVSKIHRVAEGPQILATTYCPTRFLALD